MNSLARLALFALFAVPFLAAQTAMPDTPVSPDYKEAQWIPAQPQDAAPRSDWWKIFSDPRLDAMEQQLVVSNQDLKSAESRFREARSLIQLNRANQTPTISVSPSVENLRDSANRPYFAQSMVNDGTGQFTLPFDLTYEVDLWGRIHKQVAAARDQAQSSAADLANVQLILQAELAYDYFELRSADAERLLLDHVVTDNEQTVQLQHDLYEGGVTSFSTLTDAKTRLQMARVARTDVEVARAQYEHAIAALLGKPPALFAIAPDIAYRFVFPAVGIGIPSQLLERRPDIASQQRLVAAANEQIGIARTAYFPSLNLGLEAGLQGTSLWNWMNWPSRFWAVGAQLSQTIFDGGRRKANTALAHEQYDEAVASYRQTTLKAFEEVEDNLSALRTLNTESVQQAGAIASAQQTLDVMTTRYQGGIGTPLDILGADLTLLSNQSASIDIDRRRIDSTILLIKATGGGWDATQLASIR